MCIIQLELFFQNLILLLVHTGCHTTPVLKVL